MNKIISVLLSLILILGLAGCGAQKQDESPMPTSQQIVQSEENSVPFKAESTAEQVPVSSENTAEEQDDEFDVADGTGETQDFSKYKEVKQNKYFTDDVPEGKQQPVEPGDVEIDKNSQKTCYLTISCATILDNMDELADGKDVLVPADGLILPRTEVTFYEGESVFDVLQRETRNRGIHMENSFVPMYNSAYIEGIANLYEFDCGSDSGWTYKVNGWFPNYGVSRYVLQQGDELEFLYTCDLGRDLGAN